MIKKIISIIIMLLMITALPLQAFAMAEVSVELPFTVANINGTVVIEAVDGAPLPELTEFKDVANGVFKLSFSQPDTYRYRVYQQIPENANGVIFDKTVYKITLIVLSDEEGTLQSVCTISIDGSAEKQENIRFENELPKDEESTTNQTTTPPNNNEQTTAPSDDNEQTSSPSDNSTQTTLPPNGTEQTTPPPSDNNNNNDQNPNSPNDSSQSDSSQNPPPNTGDNSNLGLLIMISVLSLAGIFMMLFAIRREKAK